MKALLISLIGVVFFATPVGHNEEAPWREVAASPRVEALRKQIEGGETNAVGKFWEEMKIKGTPLIERIPNDPDHVLITFLYRSENPTSSVVLLAQLYVNNNRDDSVRVLTRLLNTDIWYKTYWIRSDMRFSYSFVPNPTPESLGNHPELQLQDPLNPKSLAPGTNVGKSLVELPLAASQPWINPNTRNPKGKLEEDQIESKILKSQRGAWIYTPAGYDSTKPAPYPLLICFDGWVYSRAEFVPTPTILDSLIAERKIPPIIALFVGQAPQPQRNIELTNNQPFLDFVVDELLPHVRQKWRITSLPQQTILCGSSTGGLASVFFAFRRPDLFGNVLSQSGAFWPGRDRSDPHHEWLTDQIQSSRKTAVRFALQVGVLETGGPTPLNGPTILKTNRHLRDVLAEKGYDLQYSEMAGGHEPITWRGGLAEGLIHFLGGNVKP
jgi:enterochelin esterase family protein